MLRRSWIHAVGGKPGESSLSRRRSPRPTGPRGPRPTPTLLDDAAHSDAFKDHEHKEWFTEWWYFNVRDPKTNTALLGMYSASPFGLGIGAFAAMIFREGEAAFDVTDPYPSSQVKTSPTRADLTVGPNRVEVIDENRYHIVASSRDGRIAWDLTLERALGAAPAWLLDNAQGPLDWEDGWWMSWMPVATASGTLTIDGVTQTIEGATAYHDHNWGVWYSPARNWQWLQCASLVDGVALDLGYSDGFDPPRVALLQLGERAIRFEASGIDLPTYAGFQYWPDTPWKYPESATTTLVAPDERLRLEVGWSATKERTCPLMASIFLVEQDVDVTLRISERASAGEEWGPARTVATKGIAEWSESYFPQPYTGQGLLGGYKAEVTVFGGGISGLSAAHELADRGFDVTVIEPQQALDAQGDRGLAIGGMARSHYARVPRLGPAPANRPAGRPTANVHNDTRDDTWRDRRVVFAADSWTLPEGERAIAHAAHAFGQTYAEKGYRLRVAGSANPVEKQPRALGARRAEAVRERLVELGVAPDCVVLAEDRDDPRPEVVIALEDYVLPGEHGFRFFPSYYRHVTDTMSRIPVYDQDGRMTERRVLDNLKATPEHLMLRSGRRPALTGAGTPSPLQMARNLLQSFFDDAYDPRDFLQMGIRLSRYLATCPERRVPLEDVSWWNYLCGFSPKTQCYLYRYSNAFSRDAVTSGRVLAAFDWRYGDARTNGSTWTQLFAPSTVDAPLRFDGTLNAPTSDAWFVHWRRFLSERGVRFVSGSLDRLEVEKVDGKDVVVAWARKGDRPAEPWQGRTREHQYFVVATDAPTAERASSPLPKVGVPQGLLGYTTRFDGRERDPYREPGITPADRFQTLSGVQYFFAQDFAIGGGAYSLDAPWSLTTVSMQRIWGRVPCAARDGYAGMLTVDIGDFKVPAGPTQTTAWDSTLERLGEQVWTQLSNDLRTDALGPSPLRLPRPLWFHVDDNLEFGDRDGMKGVIVRNGSPYLVPIKGDWARRPGPEPFDPNAPAAPVAPWPTQPGVWRAPHGGYPVHWDGLAYAGIYLKTFTRMTTMESANESARHAVNAIVDHYNAHHGSVGAPPSPSTATHADPSAIEADMTLAQYLGDYCGIWNIERYEPSAFDTLKSIDQILLDLGLPHLFDLLGIELVPSVLSHIFPYRGDCSSTGEAPPPPIPPPAPWCPPFVGQKLGSAVGKIVGAIRRRAS
ncbi:MAG TPA: FAD-dependent oxidoreductase [Polyangiaceae bacterium]|jgi:outer membrane protein OmpA-like peptidoglycan-associated protein|nr:FAD-dependent oxidoreductase [Polyangiaceae bacterium]